MYKKKILIVEDEGNIANLEREIFEREGFEIDIAENGIEGLEKLKQGTYEVILSDFCMPIMMGDKFYMEVKKLRKNLEQKIIFVTGYPNDFIQSTGNKYLLKPFSRDQIISVVKESLASTEKQYTGIN